MLPEGKAHVLHSFDISCDFEGIGKHFLLIDLKIADTVLQIQLPLVLVNIFTWTKENAQGS